MKWLLMWYPQSGSQDEMVAHVVPTDFRKPNNMAAHTAPTFRKKRWMLALNSLLPFFIQPRTPVHAMVPLIFKGGFFFPPQPILSGNTLTNTPMVCLPGDSKPSHIGSQPSHTPFRSQNK